MEIGLHHEQQHQELLLTDILHAFAQNPTDPVYDANWQAPRAAQGPRALSMCRPAFSSIGHDGEGFCFDNETPRHDELIPNVRIARHLVSNAEWLAFIERGGYTTPSLWLSDGWTTVQNEGWQAPGYWREQDGAWHVMTLGGLKPVDPDAPVLHVSYYEAEAFARFAGKHLPSEAEWEVAARAGLLGRRFWHGLAMDPERLSAVSRLPRSRRRARANTTASSWSARWCCAARRSRRPHGHERVSYRNFFYPPARWQFTGLRLAEFSLSSQTRRLWSHSHVARLPAARPTRPLSRPTCWTA